MDPSEKTLFQVTDQVGRELSEEDLTKLLGDVNLVSEFKQNKLEVEAQRNWDLFYKRNSTKFFKDRHWTKREFEEFSGSFGKSSCTVLEVGCGVGNFMFPLLEENPNLVFFACDFSPRAIDFIKMDLHMISKNAYQDCFQKWKQLLERFINGRGEKRRLTRFQSHPSYSACRCTAFQCDITKDSLTDTVPEASVDVATLIFVLSAIHPEKMTEAVRNIEKTLKPGGVLLVRDYGLYDHAMLRFAKGHKLSDCFYVRQDGTRAYYFSVEKMNSIMEDSGLKTLQSNYINRSTVNKKEGVDVSRTFVQGKFIKSVDKDLPESSCSNICGNSVIHDQDNHLEISKPKDYSPLLL